MEYTDISSTRRIKTVFAGIGCTNRRIVFLTQREGETPLGTQAFTTRVKLAIPAGRAGDLCRAVCRIAEPAVGRGVWRRLSRRYLRRAAVSGDGRGRAGRGQRENDPRVFCGFLLPELSVLRAERFSIAGLGEACHHVFAAAQGGHRRAADAAAAPAAAGGVATAVATAPAKTLKPAMVPGTVTNIVSPMKGKIVPLAEVPDAGFASGAVGKGVGIDPSEGTVVSPGDGEIILTFPTGHAVGIRLNSGVEMLVHIGIDTVNMQGEGFNVHVAKGDKVSTGDPLVSFDRAAIEAAGYSAITPVLVTNHRKFASVEQDASGVVAFGDQLLKVTAKDA